jgi:hypothetical protein
VHLFGRIGLVALAAIVALAGSLLGNPRALAQEQQLDWAYDEAALAALGYPAIEVAVSEEGVVAPSTLPAGIYHVTLSVSEGNNAYVDFMQPPAGLSVEEMTQGALDAGANDQVQPGWGFAGGGNTPEAGVSATFLIELAPGDYQIAASYYPELAEGEEYDIANEIMQLSPLTVTDAATPAASPAADSGATPAAADPSGAPNADVVLEMTDDLRYIVSPDPVPAGPQLWEITNTGTEHSHHVVMYGVPDGTTADAIVADFAGLMSGTPPASEPLIFSFTGTAYAALQSGGHTTWNILDLDPGSYAVICFIIDPMTGMPHALDGMVTVFTVV